MVADSYDVVMVGAGGDGPTAAWKLGAAGLDVLVLEAGPFHGNEKWERPHERPDGYASKEKVTDSPGDLSGSLLDQQFTKRELEMAEKLLWGPADTDRGYWLRKFPGDGAAIQAAGVGGTTLLYTSNHPRAYPAAIDEQGHWSFDTPTPGGGSRAFSYGSDLVPYYKEVEEIVGVHPAPVTAKEELFFRGCAAAGWKLIDGKNVDRPGYRPQPNAVKPPSQKLHVDSEYDATAEDAFRYPNVTGSTLARGFIAGNPHPYGAPFEEKAKRASNVSFVPKALATGNVDIRPNAFVTDVLTTVQLGDVVASGVRFRDTWSGSTRTVDADVVILAAGAIETPRLWLNAGLPPNEWVGKGMTIHFGDNVMGFWTEDELEGRLGTDAVDMHHGQNIAARFDFPGLGMLQTTGTGPGIGAILGFGASQSGFANQSIGDPGYTNATDVDAEPWDSMGRLAGADLKEKLAQYRRALPVLVVTDDRPHKRNGVSVAPGVTDEHGPIPEINYVPGEGDIERRDELGRICARILRAAGADHVHRSDSPPTAIHIHGTMRMSDRRDGGVVDPTCEAHDVARLFVADNSVMPNSLGGPNPTNTGQALSARTAEAILWKYFEDRWAMADDAWRARWE